MKLYVGNLAFQSSGEEITEVFSKFGTVKDVHLPIDIASGNHRGFGFVTMSSKEEMIAAIKGLNGYELSGRALTVNEARPVESRDNRGGGHRGGDSRGGNSRDGQRRNNRY